MDFPSVVSCRGTPELGLCPAIRRRRNLGGERTTRLLVAAAALRPQIDEYSALFPTRPWRKRSDLESVRFSSQSAAERSRGDQARRGRSPERGKLIVNLVFRAGSSL